MMMIQSWPRLRVVILSNQVKPCTYASAFSTPVAFARKKEPSLCDQANEGMEYADARTPVDDSILHAIKRKYMAGKENMRRNHIARDVAILFGRLLA